MNAKCCGGSSLRMVRISTSEIGLLGLEAVLERFYLEGWMPDETGLEAALLDALRQAGNYIAPAQESAYGVVLAELFRESCAANAVGREQKAS